MTKSLTWWPFSRMAAVSVRIDLDVHRNADIGSPRVTGSISNSNAATSSPSWASARFRPPPERRDRPDPGAVPSSASFRPRRTVSAATPVAAATMPTPPGPSSAASAPSHNRRWNSDRCGRSTAYRRATESARSAIAQP